MEVQKNLFRLELGYPYSRGDDIIYIDPRYQLKTRQSILPYIIKRTHWK